MLQEIGNVWATFTSRREDGKTGFSFVPEEFSINFMVTRYLDGNKKGINVRGLKNLGNTCFLNSVLQALSSCPSFVKHVQSLSEVNTTNGKFTTNLSNCLTGIRDSSSGYAYNPTKVLSLLAAFNPDFEGREEQDALEVLESILACVKQENAALVSHYRLENRNKATNLALSLIVPSRSHSFLKSETNAPQPSFYMCPFEGWSYSHLECQACVKSVGTAACRWLPTRHQVFTTLPLPIPSATSSFPTSSAQRRGDASGAATAGCLPAGNASIEDMTQPPSQSGSTGKEKSHLLPGGGPIAVARTSSAGPAEQQQQQRQTQHVPHAPAPRILAGSSPSIYSCMQEYFQEEELSGILCSACSTEATLQKVTHKHALAISSARRNQTQSKGVPTTTESNNFSEKNEVTLRILTEFGEDLKNNRVVGVVGMRDSYIGDFENCIMRKADSAMPMLSPVKRNSVAVVDPAVVQLRDQEMLRLSLKQSTYSDAVKRTGLSRLPPLLCLYLCRRTYDEVKGRMKKLVAHVSFPVLLNMDQFQSADGAHRSVSSTSTSGLSVMSMLSANKKEKGNGGGSGGDYQLRAVVEHKGTAETGHYVAYCLVKEQPQRQWQLFSDEQHIAVSETTVLAAQATMLFYERIGAR